MKAKISKDEKNLRDSGDDDSEESAIRGINLRDTMRSEQIRQDCGMQNIAR